MENDYQIVQLDRKNFHDAVDVVLRAKLDTKEEIEHHLQHLDAHFTAIKEGTIIGVIGWYQDNVNYADQAMGDKFPGEEAYWIGFFAVDENYRRKGVGKALLNKLEEELKEKTVKELWVSSVPETKSYYEKRGFRLIIEGEINGNKKYFLMKSL